MCIDELGKRRGEERERHHNHEKEKPNNKVITT